MMAAGSCIIRNFRSTDLHEYVRFHVEAESLCHSHTSLFLASLKESASQSKNFSEENVLLAEEQGRITGACRIVPEEAIDRAVLQLLVMPDSVGRGVATELLFAAIQQISRLELSKAHADLRETDQVAHNLFSDLGFKPVRRYSEMALELEQTSPVVPKSGNLYLRRLERGEEIEFTTLQNHVFEGSWGFCPNTKAEIKQLLNTEGYGHDGVIIAYQDSRAVGYCWTAKVLQFGSSTSPVGRIHMFGVAPEFRGRGLAEHILSAGLKHLMESGVKIVELTVDNENTPACLLYRKAGFQLKLTLVWYEKQIRKDRQ